MGHRTVPTPFDSVTTGRDWVSVALLLGGVLLLFYVLPVFSLLFSVPPRAVLARLTDPTIVNAVRTSLITASVSTAIGTVLGLPLAYWLARTEGPVQTAVLAVVVLPLVLPPVVGGIVLLTLFGPGSTIGAAAIAAGVPLTRSLVGIILAQTFVASPFVVVTAKAAFEGVDRTLEHASRSLGKSRLTTIRHVTAPLAGPGIIAGITLMFARAIGEFGATLMVSYYPRTMPVQIWVAFIELGLDNAYPVVILLIVTAAVALVILNTIAANPWI